jgi:hypothetical protein
MDGVVHDPSGEALVRYVELNDAYHDALRRPGHPTLARAVANVVALPFAAPGRCLVARVPASLARDRRRGAASAPRADRRSGRPPARAEAIAREHAQLAQMNLNRAREPRGTRTPARRAYAARTLTEEEKDEHQQPEAAIQAAEARRPGAELADRPVRVSEGARRVHELARRAGTWRDTSALFDQSHHMTDLYVEGPDVIRLPDLGVNLRRTPPSTRPSSSSPATTTAT